MANGASPWTNLQVSPERILGAGYSIQVSGRFNPLIFHPAWFLHYNLISDTDFDEATHPSSPAVVAPGVCQWNTASVEVNVGTSTLSILTTDETRERIVADLVAGAFMHLHHTPVTSFECERFVHFDIGADGPRPPDEGEDVEAQPSEHVQATLDGLVAATFDKIADSTTAVENVTLAYDVTGSGRASLAIQPSAVAADAIFVAVTSRFSIAKRIGSNNDNREIELPTNGRDLVEALKTTAGSAELQTRTDAALVMRRLLEA